jgi:hypothetical protein
MKRTVFTFVMMAALSLSVCGQNSNRKILQALADNDDVMKISVGSVGMWLAKLAGALDDVPELKGINSVEILTVSDECSSSRKEKIKKQMASLSDDSEYATLMQVKDEGDKVRMLIRQENEVVKELLMTVLSNDGDSVVIRIKGKMKLSDIQEVIKKNKKNENKKN